MAKTTMKDLKKRMIEQGRKRVNELRIYEGPTQYIILLS